MPHPFAADIPSLYERHAAAWVEQRGDVPDRPDQLDRILSLLAPSPHLLDLGCGSGRPIARYLIERGCRVTGVDVAPSLIARARVDFPDQEWIVADMRDLALDRRFDGVIAWYSLFHLCPDDQRPLFARLAAHARPGALLLFPTGPREGDAIGEWQGEPLYHGSLDPTEYRELLSANGYDVLAQDPQPEAGTGYIWLARKRD